MNTLRRTGALLFAICLSVSLCTAPGLAMPPPPSVEGNDPTEITRIFDPNVTVAQFPILPLDGDIQGALPQTVLGFYGQFEAVACPVAWEDTLPTEPGLHTIFGTVAAPEGYHLKPDAGLETTSLEVAFYREEPVVFFPTITNEYPYHCEIRLLPLGGDVETVLPYAELDMYSQDGKFIKAPVEWDLSALDVDKLGRQSVYSMPVLPAGTAFLGEQQPLEVEVYVMAEDTVDLGCCSVDEGVAFCQWLMELDPEETELEYSVDGEIWVTPPFEYKIFPQYLWFGTENFASGTDYYIRLLYQDRSDGVLRLCIPEGGGAPVPDWGGDRDGGDAGGSLPGNGDTSQKPPQPDEDDGGGDYGSGNTNGGGSNSTRPVETVPPSTAPSPEVTPQPTQPEETQEPSPTPSPETQAPTETPVPLPTATEPAQPELPTVPDTAPPPPPRKSPPQQESGEAVPAQPTPSAGDFMEVTGETRDLISGTRLRLMLESAGQAQFSKQGVTVTFTAQAVKGLSLRDSDRVAVTIVKESGNCVILSLSVNDLPVTEVPETRLMVPYVVQTPGASLSLLDEGERAVDTGSYDETLAVASFTVDTTGRFTIVEESGEVQVMAPTQVSTQPHVPVWPALLLAGVVVVAGVGVGLLLKRRAG